MHICGFCGKKKEKCFSAHSLSPSFARAYKNIHPYMELRDTETALPTPQYRAVH